ncbi:carbon-nitrogen hydrolase family protein [Pseudoteredinibacter isoporae]|uniref:Aliphatic nitrilase n=1 Tax=Pseudoteredinibacter isoporae TaxID=570281 RepID=A0A7X0MW11_9GAMM|nr:carbon-nitrogen hydrolase family protein [Pseudoteredinibacter isoporae]MBB6521700.1 aliphatic nitrilase [Pseudoteredinibacter isoporae]NHO87248.1 carbon-nitrogen hydrolase family protein [Pseudoteredinibacter isoporae]NIB23120.1 carbon-nitrogen hydrolase family protein [Pseudoteredinibacter isoporae]
MSNSFKAAAVQAAPEFMNIDAGVDKAIALIEQAAAQGAAIIAFPECWLPGYPWWLWLSCTAHNMKYFQAYHENCVEIGDRHCERLTRAAKDNQIMISMGFSERDHGSLYIAQMLIGNDGEILQARRKLKPTHMERTVFGEGDGSDLAVIDCDIARVGQLCCWEHLQPLSKYAMYGMHEQLHIASWPSFSCYPDAYALGAELNNALSQVYAAEGQCYVLAPCGVVSEAMIDLLVENEEQAALISAGGGAAQIFGPDGRPLCSPLAHNEEGMLIADIDISAIAIAKSFADPVGHYSRPDVTRLVLNRQAMTPVAESLAECTLNEEETVLIEESD